MILLVIINKVIVLIIFTLLSSVSFSVVVLFRLDLGHVVVVYERFVLVSVTILNSPLFFDIPSVFIELIMLLAHLCVDLVIAKSKLQGVSTFLLLNILRSDIDSSANSNHSFIRHERKHAHGATGKHKENKEEYSLDKVKVSWKFVSPFFVNRCRFERNGSDNEVSNDG